MFKNYIKKLRNSGQKKSASILDIPDSIFSSENRVGSEQYFDNVIVHRCVNLIAGQFNNLTQHCIFEFVQYTKNSVANDKIQKNLPE
jgi:hypothetical protein